jgi:hypothetical protein
MSLQDTRVKSIAIPTTRIRGRSYCADGQTGGIGDIAIYALCFGKSEDGGQAIIILDVESYIGFP